MTSFIVLGRDWPARQLAAYIVGNLKAPCFWAESLEAAQHELESYEYDYLLSINNLDIVPAETLDKFKLAINLHPAPLPEYAGVYCHWWGIENSESQWAVTAHVMEPEVDMGDIIWKFDYSVIGLGVGAIFKQGMEAGVSIMGDIANMLMFPDRYDMTGTPQDLSKRRLYTFEMAREKGWVR